MLFYKKYHALLQDKYIDFEKSMETPLKKSIRINTHKINIKDFLQYATLKKWNLQKIPWYKEGFYVDRDGTTTPLGKDILHILGYFYIQESSSMIPPQVLDASKNDIILDMCASPGSKTTQLSNIMKNTGVILANEISTSRISALTYNITNQLAINTIRTNINGNRFGKIYTNTFDKILLDAPCSAEGTYRKDKSINKFCQNPKIPKTMYNIQIQLIQSAFEALKINGQMVYSTCTMTKEENEDVINFLIDKYKNNVEIMDISNYNFKYESIIPNTARIWPHLNDSEGFFVAKLKKLNYTDKNNNNKTYEKPKNNTKILDKNNAEIFFKQIYNYFDIDKTVFDNYILLIKNNEIIINTKETFKFSNIINIFDNNFIIAKYTNKNELYITHLFTQLFGQYATKNIIQLDDIQTLQYIQGKDLYNINIKDIANKPVILKTNILNINNIIIGKGLVIKSENKIKNQFPRNKIYL